MTMAMVRASNFARFMSEAARPTSSESMAIEEVLHLRDRRKPLQHERALEVLLVHHPSWDSSDSLGGFCDPSSGSTKKLVFSHFRGVDGIRTHV